MNEFYKPLFKRFVKKQSRPFQLAIEDEVERVKENPDIGEGKTGDLKGIKVHKFRFQGTEYLMAYKVVKGSIIFYMLDTHENFYRELKRYIKEE